MKDKCDTYWRGQKFVTLIYVIFFLGTQTYKCLTFRLPGSCSKVLNLLWTLGISKKRNVFFSDLKNPISLHQIKKANKKHTANSKSTWASRNKQPISNYCLRKKILSFLSYEVHFASCHQAGCCIRQSLSTSSNVQKKSYNYCIFFLCLK